MRHLFMTSKWTSDVTINRPNQVAYFSLTFRRDWWGHRYMQQNINDTKMSYIDTYTIVINLFYIGRAGVSVDDMHYLEPQRNRLLRHHTSTLIWMRTVGQLRHVYYHGVFMLRYAFYRWTRQKIHNTMIVVDRYLQPMEYKTIPDSAESRLNRFIPHIAGTDLPHQSVVDSYNPPKSIPWFLRATVVMVLTYPSWNILNTNSFEISAIIGLFDIV